MVFREALAAFIRTAWMYVRDTAEPFESGHSLRHLASVVSGVVAATLRVWRELLRGDRRGGARIERSLFPFMAK